MNAKMKLSRNKVSLNKRKKERKKEKDINEFA